MMANLKVPQIGVEESQLEQLTQCLHSVYCEREALANQIRACQWNTQGNRAAELTQILSAVSPCPQNQQCQTQQRTNQSVQAFTPSNEIAERISMMGSRVPCSYQDMSEYSKIENPGQSADVKQNAECIAKACEQFSQTTRQAIQVARQARDEVTVQVLTNQLRPAEQLAMQLRRFQ